MRNDLNGVILQHKKLIDELEEIESELIKTDVRTVTEINLLSSRKNIILKKLLYIEALEKKELLQKEPLTTNSIEVIGRKELSELWNVSVNHLREYEKYGMLHPIQINKRFVYTIKDCSEFLEKFKGCKIGNVTQIKETLKQLGEYDHIKKAPLFS